MPEHPGHNSSYCNEVNSSSFHPNRSTSEMKKRRCTINPSSPKHLPSPKQKNHLSKWWEQSKKVYFTVTLSRLNILPGKFEIA